MAMRIFWARIDQALRHGWVEVNVELLQLATIFFYFTLTREDNSSDRIGSGWIVMEHVFHHHLGRASYFTALRLGPRLSLFWWALTLKSCKERRFWLGCARRQRNICLSSSWNPALKGIFGLIYIGKKGWLVDLCMGWRWDIFLKHFIVRRYYFVTSPL